MKFPINSNGNISRLGISSDNFVYRYSINSSSTTKDLVAPVKGYIYAIPGSINPQDVDMQLLPYYNQRQTIYFIPHEAGIFTNDISRKLPHLTHMVFDLPNRRSLRSNLALEIVKKAITNLPSNTEYLSYFSNENEELSRVGRFDISSYTSDSNEQELTRLAESFIRQYWGLNFQFLQPMVLPVEEGDTIYPLNAIDRNEIRLGILNYDLNSYRSNANPMVASYFINCDHYFQLLAKNTAKCFCHKKKQFC